ncbi:hypothetical protein [Streptacidiphilus sp. EB103A]
MEPTDLNQVFTGPARTAVPGATTAQDKPQGSEDQGYRDEN